MDIGIRNEMKNAIARSGQSEKRIAVALHTTPSNIANWLMPTRTLPLQRLIDLANYLDDMRLRCKIWEYQFGFPMISDQQLNGNTPIAWIISSSKEEADRHKLELKAQLILNKPPKMATKEDLIEVQKFYKELREEVESENNLDLAIADWIKQAGGGLNYGHQGFKQHESYLSNARR